MTTAITGGIGSGKSYVCRLLQQRGIEVFNCDIVAKHIIATDPEVREALQALIGTALTKESLGAYLRSSTDHATRVNAIVHPRVAKAFVESGMEWMECAILFESGFDRLVDRVVVVTCPEEERIRRIIARDHCDRATALRWLALQMTDEERLQRARMSSRSQNESHRPPFHVVNDGITPIEPQIDALLSHYE